MEKSMFDQAKLLGLDIGGSKSTLLATGTVLAGLGLRPWGWVSCRLGWTVGSFQLGEIVSRQVGNPHQVCKVGL